MGTSINIHVLIHAIGFSSWAIRSLISGRFCLVRETEEGEDLMKHCSMYMKA